ncbi:Esterase/lipase superfamily enzyme [Cyclonatronum proteinivorum]|uniref:Esterase/lipase superfamily enzyme n=1 Tax=Cyclonatronum proteinivorum TaxID=1457365 RepID=A0A345ULJ5_9BACT|nr:hypothetical protein [Cyclonatronum proteinivorum]AXJ01347.1 Esterase/lipase superfamily enzyme [Cyclonatronum proteinivorum]
MECITEKWNSPSLGGEAVIRIYGNSGTPVLFFNTLCDASDADGQFLSSIAYQIENDYNIVFTLESPDYKLIFDTEQDPRKRLVEYLHLESFVIDELIPRILKKTGKPFIISAGVGAGGYLVTNMLLRHPSKFNKCIAIGGIYDMRPHFDGSVDEDYYYNNPIEYLPHLSDEFYLDDIRKTDIRIATYPGDDHYEEAEALSDYFDHRNVPHQFDVCHEGLSTDLETQKKLFSNHIP